jgi:hypothetical protein
MGSKKGGIVPKMRNFLKKNRKAQFFLIAAVVIIVVVVSVVTISNYTEKRDVSQLYDLGQEIGVESQNVIDYGTYNSLNASETQALMNTFIKNYVTYMGGDKNIYFVFGNKQQISVVAYQNISKEDVSVCLTIAGSYTRSCNEYQIVPPATTGGTQQFPSTGGDISRVAIKIGGTEYDFKLTEGENFYFVIWQKIGGNKHVITSNRE